MRGTHDFYSKPWYDSVEYQGRNGSSQYGRVMCVLQLQRCRKRRRRNDQHEEDDHDGNNNSLQCVLIQKLQKTATVPAEPGSPATLRQHLVAAGCVHLQFAGTRMQNGVCTVDHQYELIPIDDIIRRIYLVPDYTSRDKEGNIRYYYMNCFKFDRYVKDSRTIAEKEGDLYLEGKVLENLQDLAA